MYRTQYTTQSSTAKSQLKLCRCTDPKRKRHVTMTGQYKQLHSLSSHRASSQSSFNKGYMLYYSDV